MIRPYEQIHQLATRKGLKYRLLSHEESARVRARDAASRNAHKLPPSEYTRVLLRAKDGELHPGEADRRIIKMGGRVRVQPLPRPPL